jgi:hypothetical protein
MTGQAVSPGKGAFSVRATSGTTFASSENERTTSARLDFDELRRRLKEGDFGPEMLRIAQVAPLNESVPPQLYGGTERVVASLTDELVRRGHR